MRSRILNLFSQHILRSPLSLPSFLSCFSSKFSPKNFQNIEMGGYQLTLPSRSTQQLPALSFCGNTHEHEHSCFWLIAGCVAATRPVFFERYAISQLHGLRRFFGLIFGFFISNNSSWLSAADKEEAREDPEESSSFQMDLSL